MSDTAPASDIHPDVIELAQKIVDKVNELVAGVETLDANNWLQSADDIDVLNQQLQALIIKAPAESESAATKSSTTSKKS